MNVGNVLGRLTFGCTLKFYINTFLLNLVLLKTSNGNSLMSLVLNFRCDGCLLIGWYCYGKKCCTRWVDMCAYWSRCCPLWSYRLVACASHKISQTWMNVRIFLMLTLINIHFWTGQTMLMKCRMVFAYLILWLPSDCFYLYLIL